MVKKFSAIAALSLAAPSALAQDEVFFSYAVTVFGIFIFFAFITVTVVLYRSQLEFGSWIIIGSAALLFAASEFFLSIAKNINLHRFMLITGFILLFFAAVFKYWGAIELTQ